MEKGQRTAGRISRWISILCAFVLAMAMGITVWATAEPGTTIYIEEGRDSVNIRSQASTSSDPVGKLSGGAALTVVSVVSADGYNWYQVECVINGETKTGYIREDLVEIPESTDPAETEVPEEGGETVPEEQTPTPEDGDGETPASDTIFPGVGSLTPADSGTDPSSTPAGFRPLVVNSGSGQVPAWADTSDEYYLFYALDESGAAGWYLYDKVSRTCIRYKDFMAGGDTTVSSNGSESGVSKTAFIIVVAFCVLLVVATAIMGIKLMNGGGSDDYDDYDDDDDYDDEEEEEPRRRRNSVFRKFSGDDDDDYDEEDEEDDYEDSYDDRRRSSARQTHQVAVQQGVRTARPVSESRQPIQNRQPSQGRPAGQVQGRPPVQGRPMNGARPAGQQPTRPAGQQQARPVGSPAQGQQRYVQRQSGQQRYAQRSTTTRRDDGEY